MDLSHAARVELLLWLTNGDGAGFYPLFLHQRNHCAIRAKDTTLQQLRVLWLRCSISFAFCYLRGFHPASSLLGESAHRLLVGLHRDHLLHHLSYFVERHESLARCTRCSS